MRKPTGTVYKKCCCPNPATGRRGGRGCPRLDEEAHGSWCFGCSLRDMWGRRHQVRRGGFTSRTAAVRERNAMQRQSREQTTAHLWTVERWLRFWLSTRLTIRPGTARSYRTHIDRFLVPHLGRICLAGLTTRDIAGMFAQLAATPSRRGKPYSPAMLQRIRGTLHAALNRAIREGLISDNPARRVELPNPYRPHAVVWTEQRIKDWKNTGERPAVAVWTVDQLAHFLETATDDRLHPVWWIIALRGLRRGEAAGLRWCDVDLKHRTIAITQQITTIDGKLWIGPPKSRASQRVIALDKRSVQILTNHARVQRAEAIAAGRRWHDTGYVFTQPDGTPLNPNYLTYQFRLLAHRSGLPPIRLHDLRHGAASLAHTAGADLKTVQDQLGHASIVLTADTYTSVLDIRQHQAAAATARLVLQAARRTAHKLRHYRPTAAGTSPITQIPAESPTGAPATGQPQQGRSPAKTHRADRRRKHRRSSR